MHLTKGPSIHLFRLEIVSKLSMIIKSIQMVKRFFRYETSKSLWIFVIYNIDSYVSRIAMLKREYKYLGPYSSILIPFTKKDTLTSRLKKLYIEGSAPPFLYVDPRSHPI